MIHLWGLKTCDACRHARRWLDSRDIGFIFHDVRETIPTRKQLDTWLNAVGIETLINRRSTTWRTLPESEKQNIRDGKAISILERHPALLKRPILEHGKKLIIGFDTEVYKSLMGEFR